MYCSGIRTLRGNMKGIFMERLTSKLMERKLIFMQNEACSGVIDTCEKAVERVRYCLACDLKVASGLNIEKRSRTLRVCILQSSYYLPIFTVQRIHSSPPTIKKN